jgi:5-methylcytosine-specific restriction endonuclease McrA
VPGAPLQPCPRPHCGRLTRGGLCPTHRQERERRRGTAQQRGYTAAWAAYSRAWLQRFPWCGQRADGLFHVEHSRCAARGERVAAEVTDHIRSLRDGGARMDPRNHQSLCKRCNTRKG